MDEYMDKEGKVFRRFFIIRDCASGFLAKVATWLFQLEAY